MKEILLEREPCKEVEYLSSMTSNDFADNIIGYVTKSHMECNPPGIGILVRMKGTSTSKHFRQDSQDTYGFMYHRHLLTLYRDRSQMTFQADTARGSIRKAVCGQRQVFVFKSFEEFLKFSVDHYGY